MESLLLINVDDISEDEREEIYKTLSWVDIHTQNLSSEQLKTLFKTSQQLLRFKSEQFEALLQELDELAVKKAEEKDDRVESAKSWKSGGTTIEYENLEQKYVDLKSKFKKAAHTLEKYSIEIEMLNKKVKRQEKENRRLESELQTRFQNETESETSESVKYQQKELTDVVQNKNQQISELLKDIEDVEKENLVLREKLSSVKEELTNATNEMVSMMEIVKSKDQIIGELEESLKNTNSKMEDLKAELENIQSEKIKLEKDIAEFSDEIEVKIDKWKLLLEKKNLEIQQLKSNKKPSDLISEKSSVDASIHPSYSQQLQKIIADRDGKLMELKSQLEISTQEIIQNATMFKDLKKENDALSQKIQELTDSVKELKNQLQKAHQRCSNLQADIKHAEKISQFKDTELKELLKQMKETGHVDLSEKLKQMHNVKVQNMMQEKQIVDLVQTTNKMQEALDTLEKEHIILKDRLDIDESEELCDSTYTSKEDKLKKENTRLLKKIEKLQEEKLILRNEIKDLNKMASVLSNQLIDVGQTPKSTRDEHKIIEKDPTIQKDVDSQIRALSEENEALRKGLHDILNSVKVKQESSPREIKSEVLEKLLKALDVKHISGWYHPAMRLQAELHSLEGVNKELRDQLQQTRAELLSSRTKSEPEPVREEDLHADKDQMKSSHPKPQILDLILNKEASNIEELKMCILQVIMKLNTDKQAPEASIENDLLCLESNINLFHQNCSAEKAKLQSEIEKMEDYFKEFRSSREILDVEKSSDEDLQTNVILKRKVAFLLKDNNYKTQLIEAIRNEYASKRDSMTQEIINISHKVIYLQSRIKVLENKFDTMTAMSDYDIMKKNCDEILLKYRKLLDENKETSKEELLEIKILRKSQEDLINEKKLLQSQLSAALFEVKKPISDKDEKTLAEKLAECQVKQISEKQRADHTNNLYELVKEQLNKSEDKFKEFSRYGESLLLKNITLQEQLKDAEDKLITYVDQKMYKDLSDKYNSLIQERDNLSSEIAQLKNKLTDFESNTAMGKTWNDSKEQELFNLRHQVVDLVSSSDDKILVGQLHNDIVRYREKEVENNEKLNLLRTEVCDWKQKCDILEKNLEQSKNEFILHKLQLEKKNGVLQTLLFKLKEQYFGCIPLCVEEAYMQTLKNINRQKHETFLALQKAMELESQNLITKENLANDADSNILRENSKNEFQLRRQCEFKDNQIRYLMERIKVQDKQIEKLEEELLLTYSTFDFGCANNKPSKKPKLVSQLVSQESIIVTNQSVDVTDKPDKSTKILRNVGCQINSDLQLSNSPNNDVDLAVFKSQVTNLLSDVIDLKTRISNLQLENSTKEKYINQMKISLNKQITEKQNKIIYLEKRLQEQESKKQLRGDETGAGDGTRVGETNFCDEEVISLKTTLKTIQDNIASKDKELIKYETLLKEDRDKHSLAAANLQQELQVLQKSLMIEKDKNQRLEESSAIVQQKNATVETYISQVHALEHHLAELHTSAASLEARLQASQQEASRWRILAADRLKAMEELGRDLDDQHKKELQAYKEECEKYIEFGKESPDSHRNRPVFESDSVLSTSRIDADILKLIREKDCKIRELINRLKQQSRVKSSESRYSLESLPYDRNDAEIESIFKENEVLQRRCEQLSKKETVLKEEIRDLRNQLLKKPNFVSLTKSERTIKDQLQKKISTLECDIIELEKKLAEQIAINEKHKHTSAEDFEKWKKQKYWQENYEKIKNKLKIKEEEFGKLTQTCTGYRLLIERLEREKLTLENRNRMLTNVTNNPTDNREIQMLKMENERLVKELEDINLKLEMQQHHSGGLGAAMLQEKLESQERKIAVLELSAKGSSEMRSEIERLQSTISTIQKSNLCLEAENLELKMDLEKCNKETPHLQEQIQYLASYIEVLKNEKVQTDSEASKQPAEAANTSESKTVAQLERTVFVLKRVVEKLQAENKRLLTGKRPLSERPVSGEKLKRDYLRLKEQHTEALKQISKLEAQLAAANRKLHLVSSSKSQNGKDETLSHQILELREELNQKSHLLDKVKGLLQRAAAKEKLLHQEISRLRTEKDARDMGFPSPVLEESEVSSDT